MGMQSDEQVTAAEQNGHHDVPATGDLLALDPAVLNPVYTLIDAILPFEACLYYQVFPLSLEGSRLIVGIVDPDDEAAAEYVTKQLSYINYSIQFQQITSDWHRDVLSKYLNHCAQQQSGSTAPASNQAESATSDVAIVDEKPITPVADSLIDSAANNSQPATEATSLTGDAEAESLVEAVSDRSEPPPLPEPPTPELQSELSPAAPPVEATAFIDNRLAETTYILERTEQPQHAIARKNVPQSTDALTTEVEPAPVDDAEACSEPAANPVESAVSAPQADPTPPPPEQPKESEPAAAPDPEMDTLYRDVSELLASMPPQTLMQALLDKVTGEGIGRLYLEPRLKSGRILWSCNGVLEGEIDPINRHILQGVIDEFKKLARLPIEPVVKPQQAEIERDQQGQRILIRLSIKSTEHGEQATVQILRGKALEFYRQQHMERLGRDALDVAHKLQQSLGEIRERARLSISSKPTRSDVLPQLVQLLKQLGAQIQEIEAVYEDGSPL
ncbi:MAG: hypothetical protein AAF892_15450 [Cyanobacteria bacterium P01_D01_bin.71]